MKVLSIIALILSLLGLGVGLYCQFQIVPFCDSGDSFADPMWRYYHDQKFLLGSIALFVGPVGALLGIISGIKKRKLGWIALILGLGSFVLGAMQATHMFS